MFTANKCDVRAGNLVFDSGTAAFRNWSTGNRPAFGDRWQHFEYQRVTVTVQRGTRLALVHRSPGFVIPVARRKAREKVRSSR